MQLPAGVDNAELEERIIQHLAAAAAAMGRARHGTRREGHRSSRPSTQGGHPQFMVFSPHPNAPPPPPMLSSPSHRDETDTATNLPHNATIGEGSLHSNMQPPQASSHPHQASPSASDSNSRSVPEFSPFIGSCLITCSQYEPSFVLAYTGLLINLPQVIKIELDHPNSNHFLNL